MISQQLSGETETSSAAKQLVAGEPDVGGEIRRGCRDRLQSFLLRSFLCPTHALKNRSRLLTTAVRTVQDSRGPECCAAVFDYKTFRSSGRYSDALLHDSPPVPIHQLLLQSCTETLGNRIVPAVPCVAHAATDFMTSQRRLKRRAAVLTATIRRQQKTPCTPRRPTAICRPERKTSVDISWLIDHPTTRREYTSILQTRYKNPASVLM